MYIPSDSHLIGIISKTIGFRGLAYFQTKPHNYEKSQFLMDKSTISMAIFNSYVCLPEDIIIE